jgi:hypothetical protein
MTSVLLLVVLRLEMFRRKQQATTPDNTDVFGGSPYSTFFGTIALQSIMHWHMSHFPDFYRCLNSNSSAALIEACQLLHLDLSRMTMFSKSQCVSRPPLRPNSMSGKNFKLSLAQKKEAGGFLRIAETFRAWFPRSLCHEFLFRFSNIFLSVSNRSRLMSFASFNVATSLSAESTADGVDVPLLLLLLGERASVAIVLNSWREGIAARATFPDPLLWTVGSGPADATYHFAARAENPDRSEIL